MARSTLPVGSRQSDDYSNMGRSDSDTEVPLLYGRGKEARKELQSARWSQLGLFVWAAVATVGELWALPFIKSVALSKHQLTVAAILRSHFSRGPSSSSGRPTSVPSFWKKERYIYGFRWLDIYPL